MRRSRGSVKAAVTGLAAVAIAAFALAAHAGVSATTIPAGFDLFQTDPQQTNLVFHDPETALPAGFFGPNSDPFTGVVHFGGTSRQHFMGHGVGDADTIVHRPDPATPPATVPIEIVRLNLVSMQPITVTYNHGSNPEPWDVRATLTPTQQPGQIVIGPGTGGGTFDSQLPVSPKLVFTRLLDGTQKILNAADPIPFQASSVPWRAGCILPALRVAGLNDGFCPGMTTDTQPHKQLSVEEAEFASHGVYPAQPALEHFKCYAVKPKPFHERQVVLRDQFLFAPADITRRGELCNPAQKNDEPFQNRRAHLQCYAATGIDPLVQVAVRNKLGSQVLRVHKPRRLCVPTQKRLLDDQFHQIKVPIDHYRCYAVTADGPLQSANPIRRVNLKDEFGKEKRVKIGAPYQLCAPADKNSKRAQHLVTHLVCYSINDEPVRKRVQIRNQFEKTKLKTRKPVGLCVPSSKYVIS
jgi:hypothetical protein